MSTTSVAVVYAVMLEFGLNATDYGKGVLAACFVTDLATVVALGLIFAPFTHKTLIFVGVGAVAFFVLPWLTPGFFRRFGNRPSELEAKFLMTCLFAFAALATWADSEAVLPAYLLGMVLAGTVGKDHALIRRLRTLTFGFLTPLYFIRAQAPSCRFRPEGTMISRVLLGYDGSAAADRAAEFAIELASRFGAELHVLSVARPPEFGMEVESEAIIEQGGRHCSKLLKPLRSRLEKSALKAHFEVAIGHPSEQILLYADRHGMDHVVVGHRGHTILDRWLLGSVARQVIVHASCAVTVVRG